MSEIKKVVPPPETVPPGPPAGGKVRWVLPFILLVSVIISYLDRNNLSFALPKIADEYGWTDAQTGEYGMYLFLAFFFSYGVANMLFSPIGEKYGPKGSIIIAVVFFSLFTIAGAGVGHIFWLFFATRIFLGLGEGVHFPMNSKLIKNWFPTTERSRANGIWIAGVMLAVILAPVILVPVIDAYGWRTMFVGLGAMGMLITLPLIYFFVHNTPKEHPAISESEVEYIDSGMEEDETESLGFWNDVKPVLKSGIFWIAMVGGVFNNAASYGLMQWLPTYFVKGRQMEFESLWWATSLPYLLGIGGIVVMSLLGDKTGKRALLAGVGYLLCGVIAYFAATAPDIYMTVGLFSVAIFFQMAYTSQEFAILQRILPKNRVGAGSGFYNGIAMMVGGVMGHSIVGGVVQATGNWTAGIVALLGAAVLAGITMIILSVFLKY